jgi:hypothetical protein
MFSFTMPNWSAGVSFPAQSMEKPVTSRLTTMRSASSRSFFVLYRGRSMRLKHVWEVGSQRPPGVWLDGSADSRQKRWYFPAGREKRDEVRALLHLCRRGGGTVVSLQRFESLRGHSPASGGELEESRPLSFLLPRCLPLPLGTSLDIGV